MQDCTNPTYMHSDPNYRPARHPRQSALEGAEDSTKDQKSFTSDPWGTTGTRCLPEPTRGRRRHDLGVAGTYLARPPSEGSCGPYRPGGYP